MGAKHNRGRQANRGKLDAALLRRFGTASHYYAADWILNHRWITRPNGYRCNGVSLPSGEKRELPERSTLMRFFAGHRSDYWEEICAALDVTFSEIAAVTAIDGKLVDQGVWLFELAHARRTDELLELLLGQSRTYRTASAARLAVSSANDRARFIRLGLPIVLDVCNANCDAAAIIALVMNGSGSSLPAAWSLPRSAVRAIEPLCNRILRRDEIAAIPLLDPLALTLGKQGREAVYKRYLRRLIEDGDWQRAAARLHLGYYESVTENLLAIHRHLEDQFRGGLVRGHDAPSLVELTCMQNAELQGPGVRIALSTMLSKTVCTLNELQEERLAQRLQGSLRTG